MKIVVFVGTRPETIKMAPVYRRLKREPLTETSLCSTGQHREMLDQALADFNLRPEYDLRVMTPNQTLAGLTAVLLQKIDAFLDETRPDWALVQGDTATVLAASLAAFYRKISVGHIEAGLRSGDKYSPFPEEINRRTAALVADLHFAPTSRARDNLLAEGFPADRIALTGNTVVDALFWMRKKVSGRPGLLPQRLEEALARPALRVLVTAHRRESGGQGFLDIADALAELAAAHPEAQFVYPVHLNPAVREPMLSVLSGRAGVFLTEPLSYPAFVRLMDVCDIILTDSGGLQEEGVILGKPVLVMREVTERPEGVAAGAARLVGTDRRSIVRAVSELLTSPETRAAMSAAGGALYGDGRAADRVAKALLEFSHGRNGG